MTTPTARRPWPALVFLLALCLLAALVWWRVLSRGDATASRPAPTCSTTTPAAPVKSLPQPAAVTVLVVNSTTTRQGLAAGVRQTLIADGFQSPNPAENDGAAYGGNGQTIAGVAEIRSGTAGSAGAELLAYYFPGAKLVHLDRSDATVIVSLGSAYASVRTQQAVTAALQANKITLTTAAPAPSSSASKTSSSSSAAAAKPSPTRSRC